MKAKKIRSSYLVLICILFISLANVSAQESNEDLAKEAQNPLANIMSFPFQYNINFGYGPNNERTQSLLNIQPVFPFLNGRLVTRTIFPLLWQPDWNSESGAIMGLSNVLFSAFYVPECKNITFGIGPALSFPASSSYFGSRKWSIGPSIVLLKTTKNWVYGFLLNNIWSFAGDSDAGNVNQMTLQYFINFNLPSGMYFSSSPFITANFEAAEGQQWTIPFGLGFGKIVKLGGKLPLNMMAGYYYNVVSPDFGPKSQLRIQIQMLLPTSILKMEK